MKQTAKRLLNAFFVFLNLPFLALYFGLKIISGTDPLFASFSQFYSLFPGQFGVYLRRNFYRFTAEHFGEGVVVGFGTVFSHQGIEVGDYVYIGPQSNVGLCRIDRDCLIGSGVHILSGKNQHSVDDLDRPLREQGGHFEKIDIGDNCWIGNQATLMASVGSRCVIGAGAIIAKPCPERTTWIGQAAHCLNKAS